MNDVCLPFIGDNAPAEDLRAEPAAAQIHVDEARPLVIGQLEKGYDRLDAGIVDENIDRSQLAPNFVEHLLDFAPLGDVSFHGNRAAALAANPFRDLFGFLWTGDVIHRDVGALFGEHFRNAAPDSSTGAGYDGYLTL